MNRRPVRRRTAVAVAVAVAVTGSFALGAGVAGAGTGSQAGKHTGPVTRAQVLGLFDTWNAALRTGDPREVARLYAADAVLLPTVSDEVRTDRAGITDYFAHFLRNKPVGTKIDSYVDILDRNTVIDTGVYEFALTDPGTGAVRTVEARYTYVYEKQPGGTWLIVNHHSSRMPEG
ncbi:SgcJ/EcaC family oxidoreductase [Streptomyces sp. DT190]|uniref:SgcJ/EcaC family oxidoreductase n=1 Tax=unclassified Streptomyces TaxID=2593676 RepID=UPI003CEF000E